MPTIGRKSIELDRFYTADWAVTECMKQVSVADYDLVIEPSAGGGAFLRAIDHPNVIAMDIEPAATGIVEMDFFRFQIDLKFANVLIIGNPPFGIRHKLSDAFLKTSFANFNVRTVAFVLPNTYRKPTRQGIIPPDWRIKSITPLGRDAFTLDGQAYHVPCSFFVFDKSAGVDLRIDPADHQQACDFQFGSIDDYDCFVFGANPGKVIFNPTSNNRGYFIKSGIELDTLVERFRKLDWQGNSCANGGVAWFSKVEVVKQYNDAYANAVEPDSP